MCIGKKPPSPPPLPERRPTAPKPEKTADKVVTSTKRKSTPSGGRRIRTSRRKGQGTRTLRIPLDSIRDLNIQ